MAKIMAVNAGSSSIKFQLLDMPAEEVIASGVMERIGTKDANGNPQNGIFTIKYNKNGEKVKEETQPMLPTHAEGVELLLKTLVEKHIVEKLEEITGVGHRVVQGGEYFKDSALIDGPDGVVINKILELADLAPLHNRAHVVGMRAFMKALPSVPEVAVFDTTFHQTMAEEAYMYATPYEWYTNYGIRKYGAHGTSHKYVSQRCAELIGKPLEESKIIVCHLGNGASISAVKGGKCIDTSMGLTPLEGIPMGTRSGNIDPTALQVVAKHEGKNIDELINVLNKQSGLLGMGGRTNDARDVTKGMNEGDHRCIMAFNVQAKRIVDYIGSYYVYMGGVDAIAFTAGMGENLCHLREKICNRLAVLGVTLNKEVNNATYGAEARISGDDSKVQVWVVPTNEEVMIARDVVRIANVK
jgi:acetate kinase